MPNWETVNDSLIHLEQHFAATVVDVGLPWPFTTFHRGVDKVILLPKFPWNPDVTLTYRFPVEDDNYNLVNLQFGLPEFDHDYNTMIATNVSWIRFEIS